LKNIAPVVVDGPPRFRKLSNSLILKGTRISHAIAYEKANADAGRFPNPFALMK
jgi:hypothetical protein